MNRMQCTAGGARVLGDFEVRAAAQARVKAPDSCR